MMRRHTFTAPLVALALFVPCATALGRILPPGEEASFGRAEIDLNGANRAAVAYERDAPGPDEVWVSVRAVARLSAPTRGRLIGRGALRLVRLGDARDDAHFVAWRRAGKIVASVWDGRNWRTERLPAAARSLEPLAGAVVGRRVLLVLGDRTNATALVRTSRGRWRAHPLPASDGRRPKLVAAGSELLGSAVVAWTAGAGAGASIHAASFALTSGRWSAIRVAVPPGTVPEPEVGDLTVNNTGDALLSAVPRRGASTPVAAVLRSDGAAWRLLPALPASPPQLAFAPAGVPVRAWLEDDRVQVSSLAADGLSWEAPETAWNRPPDDFGSLYAVDDLAIDDRGRVVVVAAVDPGPGPDDHAFLVRRSSARGFAEPKFFASLYGSPRLLVGREKVAAFWVEDPSSSGLPEAALAP